MDHFIAGTSAGLKAILRLHRLKQTFSERPLMAVGSAELLSRIVEYLLENGAKYAPPGGRILIDGRASAAGSG
jgi:signal transduction histidine kinase